MPSRARLRLLATIAVCASLAIAADTEVAGVHNFHQVDAHVYRGGQPTAQGFKNLAKFGIRTIIDLRGASNARLEQKLVEGDGMHYVSIPMAGLTAPTDQQIATVFAILNDPSAWPIFVHCKRGADRTGTVIACYRVAHDHWDNQKALTEARMNGMSRIERAMMHYILSFKAPANEEKANASAKGALAPAAANP